MDYYIMLAVPRSQDQLHPVSNSIMTVIHYAFPLDKDDKEDVIFLKKIMKRRPHGLLLRMRLDLNFMETQGSIIYGSLRTAVPTFKKN